MEGNARAPQTVGVFAPIMGAIIVVFVALTLLAGLPPAEKIAGFTLGMIVLGLITIGIGLLGWHLLLRPLPANVKVSPPLLLTARTRNIIALFLTMGTLGIGIAGVWDEIWHSKYGIPFGEDFFWRPHLMLYFSFLTLIVLGGWSWWVFMNRGKGTLQQRFRSNPLLGVSFLAGVYTIYAVGADPIWHSLYGTDIAPWSVPHLLILIMILVMGSLAVAFHNSLLPQREWRYSFKFAWRDVLIAFVWVGALVDFTLIFTVQWYAAAAGARQITQVLGYPDWLLAAFITFLAILFGIIALHSTRQIGSATLVGVLAFAVRFLLNAGFGSVRDGTLPILLILPLLVSMDVWYAISIRRTRQPPAFWKTALIVAVVFGIIEYPLIATVFPYLPVALTLIPARLIASAVTAVGTIWIAQKLGELGRYRYEQSAPEVAAKSTTQTSNLLYIGYAVFLLVFIVTATPPV